MRVLQIIFVLMSICFVGNTYADSDGIFCVGKDYVAIDARGLWLSADGPTTQIVTIDPGGGLDRHVIPTPPNLNKSLRCEETQIVLSDGHIIDLQNIKAPSFSKASVSNDSVFSNSQLPYIEKPRTIKIQTTDQSHYYTLVLGYIYEVPEQGLVFHHISAKVVKSTKYGTFVSSKLLAEGIRLETIH